MYFYTVTFDQINVSLLYKNTYLFQIKIVLNPELNVWIVVHLSAFESRQNTSQC